MAIDITNLTAGGSGTDANSYNTASIAPAALALLVIDVLFRGVAGSIATVSSVTGLSLTWTQAATVTVGSAGNLGRLTRLWAVTGAAPGSGALNIALGETAASCLWSVNQSTECKLEAPVQSVTNSGSGTAFSATLAAFADSNHAALGAFGVHLNQAITHGSGFTELSDQGLSDLSGYFRDASLQTEWAVNDPTVDASAGTSAAWTAIASEIAAVIPIAPPLIKPRTNYLLRR